MSETRDFEPDVMLDLETLSTRPNAAIISIGAWPFRLDGKPTNHPSFYRNVDAQSSIDAGLTIDGDSLMWWLQQADAARTRLTAPAPVPLKAALLDFRAWCSDFCGKGNWDVFRIWSHGASFDIPVLESAYLSVRLDKPWRYNAARDTRTLFHVAGGVDWDAEFKLLVGGTQHDALDDARIQATLVKKAWARLHEAKS